jgi:superfamily I DNA/RNA helicase/mRNA-degrading endonuclease RelE of RelBE toxin-antitoxin system
MGKDLVGMKGQWQPLIKPAFLNDILKLPAKDMHQIMEKVTMLTQDPRPDSKVKKQLVHLSGKLYRIRSGNYRIFYTFNQQYVSIHKIDRRDETTYKDLDTFDEAPDTNELDALAVEVEEMLPAKEQQSPWQQTFAQPPSSRLLPEPITIDLLEKLRIPKAYHQSLLPIIDEDGIFDAPGIDDDVRLQLHEYLFSRPIIEIMQQPDLVLNEVDDLQRYKNGELLVFLLNLSPEQEKYATWSLHTSGPTLVKGGPGTGKSTVALYRIRSFLDQALKAGQQAPQILFTTYTNALIRSSEQLLQQLLGSNAQYVRIDTADRVVYSILSQCHQEKLFTLIEHKSDLYQFLRQAIAHTTYEGNLLQQQAQKQTIERLGLDYVFQEINSIIVARQLPNLEAYQQTPRYGRKLPLNATQRRAVWQVYLSWRSLLQHEKKETWQQRRARAEKLVPLSSFHQYYDAVVIDEAQDLDPSVLRLLIKLCKNPHHLFVTADANQSLYGSGFSWSDIHEHLKFQGRTSILRANYRSTAEIGEAAQSYLTRNGTLEPEVIERHYINHGPLPEARTVLGSKHEAQLLASYFQKACRRLCLTIGSCAILCPTDAAGKALATALQKEDIEATYMAGRDLDLSHSGVKIMTLKSSKGLEFPIVALAGFTTSTYPVIPQKACQEEIEEMLVRERRTLFVGMTRAMRALLVVIPHQSTTPLLQGFDPSYWNLSGAF